MYDPYDRENRDVPTRAEAEEQKREEEREFARRHPDFKPNPNDDPWWIKDAEAE